MGLSCSDRYRPGEQDESGKDDRKNQEKQELAALPAAVSAIWRRDLEDGLLCHVGILDSTRLLRDHPIHGFEVLARELVSRIDLQGAL